MLHFSSLLALTWDCEIAGRSPNSDSQSRSVVLPSDIVLNCRGRLSLKCSEGNSHVERTDGMRRNHFTLLLRLCELSILNILAIGSRLDLQCVVNCKLSGFASLDSSDE